MLLPTFVPHDTNFSRLLSLLFGAPDKIPECSWRLHSSEAGFLYNPINRAALPNPGRRFIVRTAHV